MIKPNDISLKDLEPRRSDLSRLVDSHKKQNYQFISGGNGSANDNSKSMFNASRNSVMGQSPSGQDKRLSGIRHHTIEDMHFSANEINFMSVLRNNKDPKLNGGFQSENSLEKDAQGNKFKKGPPSFYENDVQKFKDKFQESIKRRLQLKKSLGINQMLAEGNQGTIILQKGISHQVSQKSNRLSQSVVGGILKRVPSRQSNTNFCNVDFDYYGDTKEIAHLLKNRQSGSPNLCQVQFETNLRASQPLTNIKHLKPWKYLPTSKVEKQDTIAVKNFSTIYRNNSNSVQDQDEKTSNNSKSKNSIDKSLKNDLSQYQSSSNVTKSGVSKDISKIYKDKFKEKNANKLRHIFHDKNIGLDEKFWECNLRDYQQYTADNRRYSQN
ncbi:UNKNOWN [Stylonychia lemnae]|uniref:Uncharacterized protein n=1 Tax=Stylonychia lemnae TaxID=5949 RepID=A0A077ZUP8_STYLE|nr:UNKNOWN [Stylonychia lemnae]|eukprot:CDW73622.1 UNKNOWN [Stylonychia lemnae]